ncbi:MAG: hypothetical protein A2W23_01310 [Planctomycetes bacterium RBG_16_43_13]|nr:MAG: hypothetical protein A2W23_01310 [Planctomycetes bacterium RBG_16_43_13]
MRKISVGLCLLLIVSCTNNQSSQQGTTPQKTAEKVAKTGKELFATNCAVCHGNEGKGDGLGATYLFPKPRDFTKGMYKVRTTSTGELPTDSDIFNAISHGMPGSAMPSFADLPESDRREIISYLKTLAVVQTEDGEKVNLFELRGNVQPIQVGTATSATAENIAKGKAVYQKMECLKCHGELGKGDGASAPELKDEWGYPIPPNNFTRGIYKGGATAKDVYLRFSTGMNGTPMPSFAEQLTNEERWNLVHYVQSLQMTGRQPIAQQANGQLITAYKKNVLTLSTNPQDSIWNNVKGVTFPLMHLWQKKEATDFVKVKTIHNGDTIAFLLEWEDLKVNANMLRPQDYPDAAAIMFALTTPSGHFTMGTKEGPTNIWQWRFDRQMDLAKYVDIETIYPGMVADDYQLETTHYPKKVEKAGHLPITSAPLHNPTYLSGWGAGNPMSNPVRTTPVEDLNAEGFGTLTAQPQQGQNVQGRGIWNSGGWKVVFIRKMKSEDANDRTFSSGSEIPLAFAIWDGENGDRDGQKAVTYWQKLAVER